MQYYVTVSSDKPSDRLWLFRLGTGEQRVATVFNKRLKEHIDHLRPIKLKRQVNLPTPLLDRPFGEKTRLDIGLHVVNDEWNGALMMFFYYEGRYYNPPHLQLDEMDSYTEEARARWTAASCSCHKRIKECSCGNKGCWKCFQIDCPDCLGTGWKQFAAWLRQGAQIDYTNGWPIAIL